MKRRMSGLNERVRAAIVGAALAAAIGSAPAASAPRANPRLKQVQKIYVQSLSSPGKHHGRTVVVAVGSNDEVRARIVASIASSGRFSALTDPGEADALLEGSAGHFNTETNGKKYTNGFAQLQLVDPKKKEVLWTFEYQLKPGAGGRAADRVADQFIEKLLADTKLVDGR